VAIYKLVIQKGRQMKTLNLLKITALSFMWIFVSGTAMAEEDCAGGHLSGFILTDIVIPEDGSCLIENAVVQGNIIATGARDVTITFGVRVSGGIWIANSKVANVQGAQVTGSIALTGNQVALLVGSNTMGHIVVNENTLAVVKRVDTAGNLFCRDNQDLEASPRNHAGGEKDCPVSLR
jgi:hypothetical protein